MMAEYIEREALIASIRHLKAELNRGIGRHNLTQKDLMKMIEMFPAADVVPVVHGRWEFIGDDYANCTHCGTIFDSRPTPYFFKSNNLFCRKCGARMDGE